MKRPWQIWILFALCLALVLPAMGWLTHRALELDRAEALAQQQAELEEAIGSALWQLDTELARLLAAEIARPASFYRSFYLAPDDRGQLQQMPSPLLTQPSPYVRLHFELRPDGRWNSPQCPEPAARGLALTHETTPENIRHSCRSLDDLARAVDFRELLARLPEQEIEAGMPAANWSNTALLPPPQIPQVVKNTLDFPPVQQQLEDVQLQASADAGPQQAVLPPEAPQATRSQRAQTRRGMELQNRYENFQAAAQQAIWDQRSNISPSALPDTDREGISQPVWVGTRLLLARRVVAAGQTRVQGCWLDWANIRAELLQRIRPVLPDADLEPLTDARHVRFSRVLATLPVQLVVPERVLPVNPASPIRVSLSVAWCFLALATVALAVLLRGVVALSERRAAFVSAVTHELRTPLTTFRMYAEMLAEGMVPDELQQRAYLNTLKVEADRLSHLVENVLQYARLERGAHGKPCERVASGALLERIGPRLQDRASGAGMTLLMHIDADSAAAEIATDPAVVEQILFNLVDNACKYARDGDDRQIHCRVHARVEGVQFEVRDHGPGISRRELRRLFRPFSKSAGAAANTAPGVGLGLALCRRLAIQLGGRLTVRSKPGQGAAFTLSLPRA